jgi:hypothetical protein
MIFQLIKIISELYYALARSLTRIRISLLIFDLKIENIIENILKIRYIKFSVDDNYQINYYITVRKFGNILNLRSNNDRIRDNNGNDLFCFRE